MCALRPIRASLAATLLAAPVWAYAQAPAADHHLHIRSAAATEAIARIRQAIGEQSREAPPSIDATQALAALDSAGIRYGAVLSSAYQFGFYRLRFENERASVMAENDYVSREVSKHLDRLRGFCSINPLKDYAVAEIGRCAALPGMVGLKLHLANSGVDFHRPTDVARLAEVFREVERRRLAVIVHVRPVEEGYGAEEARIFIRDVLVHAPHAWIQIAHAAGWGGYDAATDAALGAFADAFRSGALARDHVWFDLAAVVFDPARAGADTAAARSIREGHAQLAGRIREIGVGRFLFASDWPGRGIRTTLDDLRAWLPLRADELGSILQNLAPYFGRS